MHRKRKKIITGWSMAMAFGFTGLFSAWVAKTAIEKQSETTTQTNFLQQQTIEQIDYYNQATPEMFNDTSGLTSVHFGNVAKGQTVTPWGWLGVFKEGPNQAQKIALTAWNGEILWVNNDYANLPYEKNNNVYEIKYDWNSNLIFVVRSEYANGFYAKTSSEQKQPKIDILNPFTGQQIHSKLLLSKIKNLPFIFGQSFIDWNEIQRTNNLYYLDVASKANGSTLLTYLPNFMQLYDKRGTSLENQRTLPTLQDVLVYWTTISESLVFNVNNGQINQGKNLVLDPRNSPKIIGSGNNPYQILFNNNSKRLAREFSILVNPFFTVAQDNTLILHLIFASRQGEIFHKIIGFNPQSGAIVNKYDQIEQLNTGPNNSFKLEVKPNEWANAKNWNNRFINANLRINKNMFNPNSLVFAYPYAASQNNSTKNNFPIFNVAQVLINPQNGLVDKTTNNFTRSINYSAGKQIVDNWNRAQDTNKIKPWPNAVANFSDINHNYNRLMAVSPFDNTIIYAAGQNGLNLPDQNANDLASFWIFLTNRNNYYHPLTIANSNALGGFIDPGLTSLNSLYEDNFSFDLQSVLTVNLKSSLSLYFNHTGNAKNADAASPGFKTSKIGLLDDMLKIVDSTAGWIPDLSAQPRSTNHKVTINQNSFSTTISSRADLTKWYGRTWQNFNQPANLYLANTVLNQSASSQQRALATAFNQQLSGTEFNSNQAIDLYTDWNLGQGPINAAGTLASNYQRLSVQRPLIKVSSQSRAQALVTQTTYDLRPEILSAKRVWLPADQRHLIFKKEEIIEEKLSYEILSAWSNQVRLRQIGNSTSTLNLQVDYDFGGTAQWFDARQNPNQNGNQFFGTVNNAQSINGINPLRTMLQIVPLNNSTAIPAEYLKAYPTASEASTNETTFESILEQFLEYKSQNINFEQIDPQASLANLNIKAKLALNPAAFVSGNQKNLPIYKNGTKNFMIDPDGKPVFYEEQTGQEHWIFAQQATSYDQANQWGWGAQGAALVQNSWANQLPNQKFLIDADYQALPENLLRQNGADLAPLFSAQYKDTSDQIIVFKPTDNKQINWIKNRFQNFNQMLSLFLVLEYRTSSNPYQWQKFTYNNKDYFSDQDLQTLINDQGQIELPTQISNIAQLRFRLARINQPEVEQNNFMSFKNYQPDDKRFIANEIDLLPHQVYVNKNWIKQVQLTSSNNLITTLTEADLTNYEAAVYAHNPNLALDPDLQKSLILTYSFDGKTNLNAKDLIAEIQRLLSDYSESSQGLLVLDNDLNGMQIQAQFDLKPEFKQHHSVQFVQSDGQMNNDLTNKVNTSQIKTPIDLTRYTNILETQLTQATKTAVGTISNFSPPAMDGQLYQGQFFGQNFDAIINLLSAVGINVEYAQYQNEQKAWGPWTNQKETITSFNPTWPQIRLHFKVNPDWNVQLLIDNVVVNLVSRIINLKLDLPTRIDVENVLQAQSFTLRGNTKMITNVAEITTEVQKLIQSVLSANSSPGNDLTSLPLQIEFSLAKKPLKGQMVWFSIGQFAQELAASSTNWQTNQIWARFNLNPNQLNDLQNQYELSSTGEAIVQDLNLTVGAPLKIFINSGTYFTEVQKQLIVQGTTENYQISNLENWVKTVPQGLALQFATTQNGQQEWTTYPDLPAKLNPERNLWLRFQSLPGYQFAHEAINQPGYSDPIALTTDQVKIIINLEKAWLKEIVLNGNTRNLTIDETKVKQILANPDLLPSDQKDLINLEYSIDQQKWFLQAAFESFLEQQAGAKDATNFILKPENLQVRFGFKTGLNNLQNYIIKIDGQVIDANNLNDFNQQLVDQDLNSAVQAYININKLSGFEAANFQISGSNWQPRLTITNHAQLASLLEIYRSDQIFELYFSTNKNLNGTWNWNENQTLLPNGILIGPDGLIQQNIHLNAKREFAIKFVAKNTQYQVYHDDQLQPEGYFLDLSQNVNVQVQIINPFQAINEGLGLQFRNDDQSPKYYQGQGGFKVVTTDLNGLNTTNSALEFLANSHLLSDIEKAALEIVYTVFEKAPTADEFAALSTPAKINDYSTTSPWKSLEDQWEKPDLSGFTKNLNLKVNQYVSLALRVKQGYAQNQNFVLKDEQHSVLNPLQLQAGQQAGRVNGYQIKTALIKPLFDQIELVNTLDPKQTPLDGFSQFKNIQLDANDPLENYLGVDLKLNLFNKFHLGQNGQPLVVNKNIKLVQRDPQGITIKEYFEDPNGQKILDANGKPIPILVDKFNQLAKPLAQSKPTRSTFLDRQNDSTFIMPSLDATEAFYFGLFKNQTIEIEIVATKGQTLNNLSDFYLDQPSLKFSIGEQFWNQMKYPLFNWQNLAYEFETTNLSIDQLEFQSTDVNTSQTRSGASKLSSLLKIKRFASEELVDVVTGVTPLEVVNRLSKMLEIDFNGALAFAFSYTNKAGLTKEYQGLDIYQLEKLANDEEIEIKIINKDPNWTFGQVMKPLKIKIQGLLNPGPNQSLVQNLQVKQTGSINGYGGFEIVLDSQNNDAAHEQLQKAGFKFMVQIWNQNQQLKQSWTTYQQPILGLNNGERIEWKLVDQTNHDLTQGYYNTIALKQNALNSNAFAQVNFPAGNDSMEIIKQAIGQAPKKALYPTNSGFVIDNLKPAIEWFPISQSAFEKAIAALNPTYTGASGQATLKLNPIYLDGQHYIDLNGQIQSQVNLPIENNLAQVSFVSVEEFVANLTFYTKSVSEATSTSFKFQPVMTNNALVNGHQWWVELDKRLAVNDNTAAKLKMDLGTINGLVELAQANHTPLWIALAIAGGLLSFGLVTAFYLLKKRKANHLGK